MHKTEGDGHVSNEYTNGGPGVSATVVPAEWLNAVQAEIVKPIEDAGITLKQQATETGDQLALALKYPLLTMPIYADGGSANAYRIVTPLPTPASLVHGMLYQFVPANTNTTASTFQLGSLTAKSIRRLNGTALIASEIVANTLVRLVYSSTLDYWLLLNGHEKEIYDARKAVAGGTLGARLDGVIKTDGTCRHYNPDAPLTMNPFITAACSWEYSGSLTERMKFNVSSIAWQSTGVVRVNFQYAMADAYYAVAAIGGVGSGQREHIATINAKTTSYVEIIFTWPGPTQNDPSYASVIIFGVPNNTI